MKAITILVLREGTAMVARCLEYDIAAQGDTIEDALEAWEDVFIGRILLDMRAGRELFHGIGRAPERYFELFRRARPMAANPIPLPNDVPQPWMRAAMHPELRAL
jgi:hypothetical protein